MFNSFDKSLKKLSTKSSENVNFDSAELFSLTAFGNSKLEFSNMKNMINDHNLEPKKFLPSKVKSFVGSSSRSRSGCLMCKKRKKKCDETKPECGACSRLNLDCEYKKFSDNNNSLKVSKTKKKLKNVIPNIDNANINSKSPEKSICSDPYIFKDHNEMFDVKNDHFLDTIKTQVTMTKDLTEIKQTDFHSPSYSMYNWKSNSSNLADNLFPSTLLYEPSSFISQHLNATGILYFDYYRMSICEAISVSVEEQNFFKIFFLRLANQNVSILKVLAAWGGAFLIGRSEKLVMKYLKEAENSIENNITNGLMESNMYIVVLSYCLIMKGINVSTGDTDKWFFFMKKFKMVLDQYGGLEKFCYDNLYQNEAIWLISNFFYHDVMNSHSLKTESLISVKDYSKVFRDLKILEVSNFGLDPSSGCVSDAVLLIGEISAARHKIKQMDASCCLFVEKSLEVKKIIEDVDNMETSKISSYSEIVTMQQILKDKLFNIFSNKISSIKPCFNRLATVFNDPSLLELHLTFFEMYQYVMKIYLLIMIKGVKIDSSEISCTFDKLILRFDIILGSKLENSLCFPLFIIGLCCAESKRNIFIERYHMLVSRYTLQNVTKMHDMIVKYWELLDSNCNLNLNDCLFMSWEVLDWKVCFS